MIDHVQSGQPVTQAITSKTWNAFVDAANAHRSSQPKMRGGAGYSPRGHAQIRVKNDSGANRDRGNCLVADGVVFDATDNEAAYHTTPALSVRLAASTDIAPRICVLDEPITDGEMGWATIAGWAVATVGGSPSAHHTRGRVAASSATLTTGYGGPVEIYHVDTAASLALVRLAGASDINYVGKITAGPIPAKVGSVSCQLGLISGGAVQLLTDDASNPITVTAYSLAGGAVDLSAATGDVYVILCADAGGEFLIASPPLVVKTFITDVQVSGTTLQKKTLSVVCHPNGVESAWTTWHTGSTC